MGSHVQQEHQQHHPYQKGDEDQGKQGDRATGQGQQERDDEPDERSPLLQQGHVDAGEGGDSREVVRFAEDDDANPRLWARRKKMTNVGIIAMMVCLELPLLCPAPSPEMEILPITNESLLAYGKEFNSQSSPPWHRACSPLASNR